MGGINGAGNSVSNQRILTMVKQIVSFILLSVSTLFAQDLQTGVTFSDGMTVHAADLNASINNATILETFISNKSTATPLTTDRLLFDQVSTSSLKTVTVADLMVAGNALSTSTVRGVNTVLAGPASGSSAAPTFRALSPGDTSDPTNTGGGTTIDCSIARTFSRTLSANTAFTLISIADGETVTVAVKQAATGGPYTAGFFGITWRGGVAPTQTTTANKTDLFTFIKIGPFVYGSASQNY